MDISDDKMNVYKDLARKCESFELFKWIVGDKESWMTEAGKAETETMLKTIYNGVHITDRQRLFVDMDGTRDSLYHAEQTRALQFRGL